MILLGIEGGATHTVALFVDETGACVERRELGPGNIYLLNDRQLGALFKAIARRAPRPAAIAIGMAGARSEASRQRMRTAAAQVWAGVPCVATHDLDTALAAAGTFADSPAKPGKTEVPRVLVLSGTGSCCYGRAGGQEIKVGGWGHWLGDEGSGFKIGQAALQRVVAEFDRTGQWPRLGEDLLRALLINEPNDLIPFAQNAAKPEVAALAVTVFSAARAGDRLAREIISQAAAALAAQAIVCARRLAKRCAPRGVRFVFAGSLLLKETAYAKQMERLLKAAFSGAKIIKLEREGAWGAVALAREQVGTSGGKTNRQTKSTAPKKSPEAAPALAANFAQSPTEQRNPRSLELDRMPLRAAIELMASEDAAIPQAILTQIEPLTGLIAAVARAFKQGHRLWYIGAGTSGRLGVLDASECPPTFRTPPELVQGIMAGGQRALWSSIEGAEDDPEAGARAIEFRGVWRGDVVVGIAASARTPYVWGALRAARRRGAKTALVAFNPFHPIAAADRPDFVVVPNVGPEVLTGSTRLKAGTATKLILNMITTLAMTRIGKVVSNLMVDLNPSNVKLRDRASRIVCQLRPVTPAEAHAALERAGWSIPKALAQLGKG